MSLADSAFPSSGIFDQISDYLSSSPSAAKDAIASTKTNVQFQLRNAQGATASWFVDLSESGQVGRGSAPAGKKADVSLVLSDEEFGKLVNGKANAQKLFMSGKLKVKGDITKAGKVEAILKKAQTATRAKL